ncbi:TlpA family protein disulfide reductase [Shewanella intestini]|uniref:TlpA family protein disulfide reductase n=2 Tax=Shewanellaceae TaxID=267890 RepID=A0ABS5I4T9_9GAMM|nr:TlpA family protein disulfide reductase [Shewanella intestini]MRG37637.1 redoxin domain-containing protein [Shewanella sp. XMDDZSB0408]
MVVSFHSYAYPGMQPSQASSTLNKIVVLPAPFPIASVDFHDIAGNKINFEQFKGKVVVINMWATWCPPCVRELPALQRLADALDKDNYVLLPISIDAQADETVQPFLKSLKLSQFRSYFDPQQALREVFPLDTIPATFILNKEGELVAYVRTYVDWDDVNALKFIEQFSGANTQNNHKVSKVAK